MLGFQGTHPRVGLGLAEKALLGLGVERVVPPAHRRRDDRGCVRRDYLLGRVWGLGFGN